MNNLTIKVNKKSAWQALLSMIGLSLLFIFFIFMEYIIPNGSEQRVALLIVRIFCIIFLPLMIYALVFFAKMLISNEPLIEICDEYFYDNANVLSQGRISWSDMSYAAIEGQYFTIYVKDRDAYLKKANFFKRMLIKMNIKQGLGEIVITPALFDVSPMEFFRAFNSHFEIDGLDELEKQLECEERAKTNEK
jgi:hypothetical protein